jgi:hypothetical protein
MCQGLHVVQLAVHYSSTLINYLTPKLKFGLQLHIMETSIPYSHKSYYAFIAQMHIHKIFQLSLLWTSCHWWTFRARFLFVISQHATYQQQEPLFCHFVYCLMCQFCDHILYYHQFHYHLLDSTSARFSSTQSKMTQCLHH